MRALQRATVESHLSVFITSGELKIGDLVSAKKIALIWPVAEEKGTLALSPIKSVLGDAVSYSEIRFVLAEMARAHA